MRIKNYNSSSCDAVIIFKATSKGKAKAKLEFQTGKESVYAIKDAGMLYTVKWERDLPMHLTPDTKEGHIEINYKTPSGDVIATPKTGKEFIASYQGQKGCETPMSKTDFKEFKTRVRGKGYDDGILNATLKGLKKECITVQQCLQLMQLIRDEELRMELAAYSYPSLFDQDNFDRILNVLKSDKERKIVKDQIGL